jgi:CRISPR-associated endonuclease Cas2
MNTSIRQLILEGVKDFAYAFAPRNYPETFLFRAFLDKIFEEQLENKLKPKQRYYANKLIKSLISQKIIKYNQNNGLSLTVTGKTVLAKYKLKNFSPDKPTKWDNKYRIIIFDIEEYKRKLRTELRNFLIKIGFVRLQNSVWVYPYDCEEIVVMIKALLGLSGDVLYLTVESIENDTWLKKEFKLMR